MKFLLPRVFLKIASPWWSWDGCLLLTHSCHFSKLFKAEECSITFRCPLFLYYITILYAPMSHITCEDHNMLWSLLFCIAQTICLSLFYTLMHFTHYASQSRNLSISHWFNGQLSIPHWFRGGSNSFHGIQSSAGTAIILPTIGNVVVVITFVMGWHNRSIFEGCGLLYFEGACISWSNGMMTSSKLLLVQSLNTWHYHQQSPPTLFLWMAVFQIDASKGDWNLSFPLFLLCIIFWWSTQNQDWRGPLTWWSVYDFSIFCFDSCANLKT